MQMPINIYAPVITPRLSYVLSWIFTERLNVHYTLTDDITIAKDNPNCISYGTIIEGAIYIPDKKLLSEGGIGQKIVATGSWKDTPTLFADDPFALVPFDIFSAIFFLITRYEEYYSYVADKYGRYPATDSILYKNGWLERPLVDEWIARLKVLLQECFNYSFPPSHFTFQPTYDIDIAYSYKDKGALRNIGGLAKSLAKFDVRSIQERLSVVAGNGQDPYDSFEFISGLHRRYNYKPIYFILAALQTGPFDKNIHPEHPAMQHLIKGFTKEGDIGMHPSFDTDRSQEKFEAERDVLEKTTGKKIQESRQHFIKLVMPQTYRKLIAEGFTDDHSMGYGTHLGFRAGTGSSFLWYDIKNETITALRIHPFCFMDSTAHYENMLSAEDAFDRLQKMAAYLKATDSRFVTVFHNFSLGTDMEWKGWPQQYETLLQQMSDHLRM